jgi:transposase
MTRRRYTREFKLEAVRLVNEQALSFAEAARDLDIHPSVLRRWVKDYQDDPKHAFPGHGQQKPEQAEVTALKREIKKLKAERDILKKAAAYFASESR